VVGDYHKFILPGIYSIKVTANGYQSKTITGVTVQVLGTTFNDFKLMPDTGWYAQKVMSCRIPGNNFGDEGFTPGCIGKPDGIPYSMGRNGYVILDMGDTLYDGPGVDFKVYQSGTQLKSISVSGATLLDGPFTTIGTGNGTTAFDLNPTTLHKLRYLQIKDNNSSPATGTGAGYNLDAIAMITPPLYVKFSSDNQNPCTNMNVGFSDQSLGNPVSWNWSFPGGTPSSSTLQNPTGILYSTPGVYPVTLTISNGISSLSKTLTNFISVIQAPSVSLGNDTTICDHEALELYAGNPGSFYLWSTGETTEKITVDSAGVGYGSHDYWVKVTSQNSCADTDTINVTFDNCTGLPGNSAEPTVTVIPDPASNKLIIRINGLQGGNWTLVSTTGVEIARSEIDAETYHCQLNLAGIPNGVAVLRIIRDQKILVKKIMMLHSN
jgi:PKD repeat protein